MAALALSSLTGIAFPIVSSVMANAVPAGERGRMQGTNFALSALANAVGPISLEAVYNRTKDSGDPGTMFLVAASFYLVGVFFACVLPERQTDSSSKRDRQQRRQEEEDGTETKNKRPQVELI